MLSIQRRKCSTTDQVDREKVASPAVSGLVLLRGVVIVSTKHVLSLLIRTNADAHNGEDPRASWLRGCNVKNSVLGDEGVMLPVPVTIPFAPFRDWGLGLYPTVSR